MRRRRIRAAAIVLGGSVLAAGCGVGAEEAAAPSASAPDPYTIAAADAPVHWAPAATARLRPGVQAYTAGRSQCTTNFVFIDDRRELYLGQAAHCGYLGTEDHPDGCAADVTPAGTPVDLRTDGSVLADGTTIATGTLAYTSWSAMRAVGERDRDACAHNDFALIRLPPGVVDSVNPSIPRWGGPMGLNIGQARGGERVFGYGNSSIRGGAVELSPHTANLQFTEPDTGGWAHLITAFLPGIPGDSGAAYLDSQGYALGTLSTLTLGLPSRNSLGDLSRELRYAQQHSGIPGLRLVLGTEPFRPGA